MKGAMGHGREHEEEHGEGGKKASDIYTQFTYGVLNEKEYRKVYIFRETYILSSLQPKGSDSFLLKICEILGNSTP